MSISTPYGLKSLLECLSRATLLAQPDDVPEFLSAHVKNMMHNRGEGLQDTKEAVFQYQEQWENVFLLKERTQNLKPSVEEFPSSTSIKSSKSSVSLMVSHPSEAGQETGSESSVRILSQQKSVCAAADAELFPPLPPLPPQGKTDKMCEVPSVTILCQTKTKASELLPSNLQKTRVSKKVRGQKSAKMPSCRLTDCPYHHKQAMESKPVRANTKPETKIDPELHKSKAKPRSFDLPVSYRPKGGYIIDPELVPERVRARPLANRTTATQSALLCSRNGAPYSRQGRLHHNRTMHLYLEHQKLADNPSTPITRI